MQYSVYMGTFFFYMKKLNLIFIKPHIYLMNFGHITCSKSSDPALQLTWSFFVNSNDWFTDLIKYHLYDIKIQLWQQNMNQQTLVITQKQNTVCRHKEFQTARAWTKTGQVEIQINKSHLFSFPPFSGFHWVNVNEAVCKRAWKNNVSMR